MQEKKYIARYNRVWQKIATGAILGRELVLKEGEKLSGYREVVPKPDKKAATGKAQKNDTALGRETDAKSTSK